MRIPENARNLMGQNKTIALATCSRDGTPNCVPMLQYWWFDEDVLVVGDLFMKATSKNVKETGLVSFCVWDDQSGESYKFVGKARYAAEGEEYSLANENLHRKAPDKNFRGVVVIEITRVYDASRGENAGKLIAGEQ